MALASHASLPDEHIDALRTFKTAQAAERLAAGAGWPDTGLVAVNAVDTPIVPRTYSATFHRLAVDARVPPIPLKGGFGTPRRPR